MNRNQLKALAAGCMLLDHIALLFLPQGTLLYILFRFLGRITAPVMAFFVAEGCRYTRSRRRYALRLALFSLLSWPAYAAMLQKAGETGLHLSVLHSLLMGLLAVVLLENDALSAWVKATLVVLLCAIAALGDGSYYNVLFVLMFYFYREQPKKLWLCCCLLCAALVVAGFQGLQNVYRFGVFLVPPLLHYGYNGESGQKTALSKWGFYVFYPAHMLLLCLFGQ